MNQYELAVLLEIKDRIADLPIYKKLFADGTVSQVDLSSDTNKSYCRFWFATGFRKSNNGMVYRIYNIGLDNDTLRINIEHYYEISKSIEHYYEISKSINYKYDPRKQILLLKTSLHDMDVIPETITAIKNNLTLHANHVHKRTKHGNK